MTRCGPSPFRRSKLILKTCGSEAYILRVFKVSNDLTGSSRQRFVILEYVRPVFKTLPLFLSNMPAFACMTGCKHWNRSIQVNVILTLQPLRGIFLTLPQSV